jgi:hypothetical protein
MSRETLVLDIIAMPEGSFFEAAWIRLPSLPLEAAKRTMLREAVRAMQVRVNHAWKQPLVHEVYVQMTQVERPAGPLLLSRNSALWMPSPGVGVWPDKAPPRSMSVRDFELLVPGEEMAPVSHQLLRLNVRDEAMRVDALDTMSGTGAMLWMLVPEDWDAARQRVSTWLEKRMTEESFRGHPFYAPLLDANSLVTISTHELAACLDGVALYCREDLAERAVLVISPRPLRTLFEEQQTGATHQLLFSMSDDPLHSRTSADRVVFSAGGVTSA